MNSIKITDLLQRLKCSNDGYQLGSPLEWLRMMQDKFSGGLMRSMYAEGLRHPVMIELCDFPECQDTSAHYVISNGHHRLTAALLLGWDEIPVCDEWETSDPTGAQFFDDRFDDPDDSDNLLFGDMLDRSVREVMDAY